MRASNSKRGNSAPSAVEPHGGQLLDNGVESALAEELNVLKEYERASRFLGHAEEFEHQSASLACQALSSPSSADVLTGESAIHDVDGSGGVAADAANVGFDASSRQAPVGDTVAEDGLGVLITLAVQTRRHPLSQRDANAANACEGVKPSQHARACHTCAHA